MPYSTEWEARGVVWRFWGIVTGEELLRSNHEIYGDSRFDEISYQIVDLTRVDAFAVTEDDMLVMAASDRAAALSNSRIRVAVAAKDANVKRLSGVYESASIRSPWVQRIFESVEDARQWVEEVAV